MHNRTMILFICLFDPKGNRIESRGRDILCIRFAVAGKLTRIRLVKES